MRSPDRKRLRLTIAYDGLGFSGWQSQPDGNAVQDHLRAAFAPMLGYLPTIVGAGRTDAGVHALGQVAHVDLPEEKLSTVIWRKALNAHLPSAIRILTCDLAPFSFHAQRSAIAKHYEYRIWNHPVLHPMHRGRVWHVPGHLSYSLLRQAANRLRGRHDFASFAANRGKPDESTSRALYRVTVQEHGSLCSIEYVGNGFLYRMVRMLTGSVIQVALGRASYQWLVRLLDQPGIRKTNYCAPPEGLYLARVRYSALQSHPPEERPL